MRYYGPAKKYYWISIFCGDFQICFLSSVDDGYYKVFLGDDGISPITGSKGGVGQPYRQNQAGIGNGGINWNNH